MATILTADALATIATEIESDRITMTYPESMRFEDAPDLIVDGVRWCALAGSRVSPDIANQRKIARAKYGIMWSDVMCKPHFAVHYCRASSSLRSALGR
jgi:hypothetical protein